MAQQTPDVGSNFEVWLNSGSKTTSEQRKSAVSDRCPTSMSSQRLILVGWATKIQRLYNYKILMSVRRLITTSCRRIFTGF